jgi:hypothetical protein
MEGAAYFSMGVLYDNMGQYSKALVQFSTVTKNLLARRQASCVHDCVRV